MLIGFSLTTLDLICALFHNSIHPLRKYVDPGFSLFLNHKMHSSQVYIQRFGRRCVLANNMVCYDYYHWLRTGSSLVFNSLLACENFCCVLTKFASSLAV